MHRQRHPLNKKLILSRKLSLEAIIAPPPTGQQAELTIPATAAPVEALQQVPSQATKRTRKTPKYYGYDNEDSSSESTNSCPPNFLLPRRKRRAGDIVSVQPSVVQTIMDTATQMEPIPNQFPSPIIGAVSPTDSCIWPADQSPSHELIINEEDM